MVAHPAKINKNDIIVLIQSRTYAGLVYVSIRWLIEVFLQER